MKGETVNRLTAHHIGEPISTLHVWPERNYESIEQTEKSAFKTNEEEKRLQDKTEKRLQDSPKKRRDIINPVGLFGVVSEAELKGRLLAKGHQHWATNVRRKGLLLLVDYAIRHSKNRQVGISADLARRYVSKLRKTYSAAIKEPLPLLCDIGILECVRPGVHAHIKASAVYRVTGDRRIELRVELSPKLASKVQNAGQRCQKHLNRKYSYREQLLNDLSSISFAPTARPFIAKMLQANGRDNVSRLVSAIDGKSHNVWTSERGQITTSISSCPKELRLHLVLNEEPVTDCDVSHAHWNFLPLVLANRLRYCSNIAGREKYITDGWREHDRLTLLLSEGDFYRAWCKNPLDDVERDEKKDVLNILLNKENEDARANCLYRRVVSEFPITFGVLEDIKAKDYRNLGKQLQRFMADALAAALVELQQKEIAAIPLVDALICQQKNHALACDALGKQVFNASGVCAKIGGIRYSPLTEIEEQALAFDETAPCDNPMTYDEWEALRAVKRVVALKLMCRYPPLFVPIALAANGE